MTIYEENQSLLQVVENVFNTKYARKEQSCIKLFGYNFLTEVIITATGQSHPASCHLQVGGGGESFGHHVICRWVGMGCHLDTISVDIEKLKTITIYLQYSVVHK